MRFSGTPFNYLNLVQETVLYQKNQFWPSNLFLLVDFYKLYSDSL